MFCEKERRRKTGLSDSFDDMKKKRRGRVWSLKGMEDRQTCVDDGPGDDNNLSIFDID